MRNNLKKYYFSVCLIWTVLIAALVLNENYLISKKYKEIALVEARANLNKDNAIRHWASRQGEIYVAVSDRITPNPGLAHIPERDITTPSGKQLTLMTPSYLIRHLNEYFSENYGIVGHITSTKLIRPENKPDDWEKNALLLFETGVKETSEYTIINGQEYFRLMQPLFTDESCLKCHEQQGYKNGDIRGGLSIALPLKDLNDRKFSLQKLSLFSMLSIWLLGIIGITLTYRKFKNSFKKQIEVDKILKRQNKEFAQLNATKDKFFTIIAHDLKNPFNTMLGFSSLLNENYEKFDPEKQKKFISIIHESASNTSKLLENLLLWANTQRNTITFVPENIELYTIVNQSLTLLYNSSKSKNITVQNSIDEKIKIRADINMLLTILRNLIVNAIKYTEQGGKIEIAAEKKPSNFIQISVSDTGVGMTQEHVEKLFKISENITSKGTENESGTGIGLLLCNEFVKKHGGAIWAESEPGKGSTFYFTVPEGDN